MTVGAWVEVDVGGIPVGDGRGVAVEVGISVGIGVMARVAGFGVLETVSVATATGTHPDNIMTMGNKRNEMCLGLIRIHSFRNGRPYGRPM